MHAFVIVIRLFRLCVHVVEGGGSVLKEEERGEESCVRKGRLFVCVIWEGSCTVRKEGDVLSVVDQLGGGWGGSVQKEEISNASNTVL